MAETNYTVLKERTLADLVDEANRGNLPQETIVFVPLGTVDAERNTDAILKITEGQSVEVRNGNFAAPSTRNFPVIPREVEMKESDSFGEARSVNPSVKAPATPAPQENPNED